MKSPRVAAERRRFDAGGVVRPGTADLLQIKLSRMDEVVQNKPAPPEWIAVLDESAADIAAGRTVPASVVRQKMRDVLGRMEKRDREAEPRR